MLVIKSGRSFHSVQVLRCKQIFKIVDLHKRSFICEHESDFNQTFHIQDSFFYIISIINYEKYYN